ncbi:MAG TPA: outer-membrane lipoprotein carrier protein LolA [Ignavibacteriales bacterium]|nr:outer-membrane lipoprotein carrier protein LolA [Ignavibacteriales bacterium]HOL81453.1 outer-membrane lipoprotein carrier protein LolA [Ignavibacteriales bacterium]HOM65351.1 outer-membrane lipoprotein carrier protein LolA [Ignavibacteriales bacterium]HPD66979.1 outer-membrane lipoprotein carrier protein LolA [Ignavibacteriales bacterium]HPP33620.1 outer-membrane lipoprotein carrier protein LolA [Ignavibacteriales bacterium]
MLKTLIFFALLNLISFCQSNELIQFINKVLAAKDISAQVTIISNKTLEGNFFYKSPNKYRYDFTNILLVTDGITFWNFDKKRNKIVIDNFDNNSLQFNLNNFFADVKSKAKIIKIEDGTFSIKETNNKLYKDATIWLKNGTIEKINFIDKDNNPFIIKFSNLKLNTKINESLFSLENIEGAKVIDLR